jgi:hypothetical protein
LGRGGEDGDVVGLEDGVERRRVLDSAHGADEARRLVATESTSCYVMIEAKRIKSSRFQVQQLAREYLAMMREARHRTPLLLVLGSPPPVLIAGGGRLSVHDAVEQHLPTVHSLVRPHPHMLEELETRVDQACAWTTWHELAEVVVRQQRDLAVMDPSVAGSIRRLTASIVRSIARHT